MMYRNALIVSLLGLAAADCHDPSPVFPLPTYNKVDLSTTLANVESQILNLASLPAYDKVSFSVEVTSSQETLWTLYRTGSNPQHGAPEADGDVRYRIASNTKIFTVLGLLYQVKAGNINLDDSVLKYIPGLNVSQPGKLPWHDITVRSLASHLSGIPRNVFMQDLINNNGLAVNEDGLLLEKLGLPLATRHGLPTCGEYTNFTVVCGEKDFIDGLKKELPVFAPNQRSFYCNDGFSLLGLVLENVTGMPYTDYMHKAIFEPLGMSHTTFDIPPEADSMIPDGGKFWWATKEGVEYPTGGAFSSSSDMAIFMRYVLTHYNGLTPALNWFNPTSFSTGSKTTYGLPWEMFTTDKLVKSKRPITLPTKSGGWPGFHSYQIYSPEHDLGIVILTTTETGFRDHIREILTTELINTAERLAIAQLDKYAGTYTSPSNVSITISNHPITGLAIDSFSVSNVQVLPTLRKLFAESPDIDRMQLVPTLLYTDEKTQTGERWRWEYTSPIDVSPKHRVWGEMCIADIDKASYAGKGINEIIFWVGKKGVEVEIPAWRVRMGKDKDKDKDKEEKKVQGVMMQEL